MTTAIEARGLHYRASPEFAIEDLSPFGKIPGGEGFVQNLDQLDRTGVTVGLGGEAQIGDQVLAPEAAGERRPLPLLL